MTGLSIPALAPFGVVEEKGASMSASDRYRNSVT